MKKVLSFVLSVAMVICLMPVMAFADGEDAAPTTTAEETAVPTATAENATGLSQFSDADSIQNKEAVAVLVGLGIVDGMGDGTFQPAGNLTRAQASKLVATLVKSGDKSEIPAPAADPFTDVAKDYWGAGAIQFGVDNGYINGMGDGTFHPEDQVTTAQLATMLDKLLGYSVADINYQWPENAIAKATISGLLDGISKGANTALSRDDAAQMLYNALLTETVVKSTDTGSQGSVDGDTGYAPVRNTKFDYRDWDDEWEQLIEKYFPKVTRKAESSDDFGRPATKWKNGRTAITDDVVEQPVLTYTMREIDPDDVEKASAKLADDLDGYVANGANVIINGSANGTITQTDSDDLADTISWFTGNGVLVELYANDKDTAITDVIVIEYNIDTVDKVESKTNKIVLDNFGEINKKDKFYSAVSSLTKDDYVLVAINGDDEIVDAVLPKAVESAPITKISKETARGKENASITAGGTAYKVSHVVPNEYIEGLTVNAEDEGTVYLDQYDCFMAYEAEDDSEAANWALLKSVYTTSENNEVGEASTDYMAVIIKEDGTKETVALMYSDDPDADEYDENTVEIVDEFINGDVTHNGTNSFSEAGVLVTYEEAASGYKLGNNDGNKSAGVAAPGGDIEKKTTKIDDIYLSNPVSVVTVDGSKASSLKISTESSISKKYAASEYQYVWKKIKNNTLVTAIFITGETSDKTLIKVGKVVGETTYGNNKKGFDIEYYTDDSTEAQAGVVSDDLEPVKGSWYTVKEIKEGMKLSEPTNEKIVNYVVKLNDTAYGNSMTLDDTVYVFASDATVVDRDESDITTVADLVAEIAEIGAKEDKDAIEISFSYKEEDDDLVISQVYIDKVLDDVK